MGSADGDPIELFLFRPTYSLHVKFGKTFLERRKLSKVYLRRIEIAWSCFHDLDNLERDAWLPDVLWHAPDLAGDGGPSGPAPG